MEQSKKLSVFLILPTEEVFSEQAIRGILFQEVDFTWDINILSNFTNNEVEEKANKYALENPHLINVINLNKCSNSENNLSFLFSQTQSEYIALLLGEDCWKDSLKLKRQVEILDSNPNCSLCFHNSEVIDDSKQPILSYQLNTYLTKSKIETLDLMENWHISKSSIMFRNYPNFILPQWVVKSSNGKSYALLFSLRGHIQYVNSVMSTVKLPLKVEKTPLDKKATEFLSDVNMYCSFDNESKFKFHEEIENKIRNTLIDFSISQPNKTKHQLFLDSLKWRWRQLEKSLEIFLDKPLTFLANLEKLFLQTSKLTNLLKKNLASENEISLLIKERHIYLEETDKKLESVLATCYFTTKKDPQHGLIRREPDINYIAPWYESVKSHEIDGIVFFDELPDEFIKKYETSKIRFRKCIIGTFSIFEERWIIYYLLLKNTNVQKAFFTDASDVIVNKNPFDLNLREKTLYVGRDDANQVHHSRWMIEELKQFEQDSKQRLPKAFHYMPVYNAGVLGGKREILISIIGEMIKTFFQTSTDNHKDMTVLNYVIYQYLRPKLTASLKNLPITDPEYDSSACTSNLVTGFPLNSPFRKYVTQGESVFIHK